MKISEEDKWLYFYTLPCTMGNLSVFENLKKTGKFNKYLKGDFSRKKVMEYFLIDHNEATFKKIIKLGEDKTTNNPGNLGLHLLVPYRINSLLGDSLACSICRPFYDLPGIPDSAIFKKSLDDAIDLEIVQEFPKEGEILLVHGDYIVDMVEVQEFKKYRRLLEEIKNRE